MSWPKTYSAFKRSGGALPQTLQASEESLPTELGAHDVLVKIHAVSLNFRDAGILHGRYPIPVQDGGIPCSDCAAEVIGKGSSVQGFEIGDRVAAIPDYGNLTGRDTTPMTGPGTDQAGVLRTYAVFEDNLLVHLPKHLSWEEGASLACAGVTAWTSLDSVSSVPPGASALFQGTGGVSMCALLMCLGAGIQPIITSSSDDKLKAIQALDSRIKTINYKTHPNQAAEVKRITNGRGVDFVINNTGPASIINDIELLCPRGGIIAMVGFLDGFKAEWDPSAIMGLMSKHARLQGIAMGSKRDFQEMNRFLEDKKIHLTPIIDRVFPFEETKVAFEYLYAGKHTGKVVIKM
ncbi:hypothetical protein NM208_g527 [Fusarium decemcellulare]|uniref:Uncharacterized protein n=1 Tax=Fusarium decemcellulare TaxID=57161 RepID=A0ACC1SZJ3_9HYPO|nr:hypothetical protein NM208_g527 [Fusarium decemcellulare]